MNRTVLSVSSHGRVAMNDAAKEVLFRIHCGRDAVAYDCDGNTRPLADCDVNNVKFVAGAWRIQNMFAHQIQRVRGKEFVLLEKIDRTEKNLFEFFRARAVGKNCYGRFLVGGGEFVVAKCETAKGTYWAYGASIEQVRAFLGIRLYDEYKDLIHANACAYKDAQK